jgi:hypothetical protein
MRTKSIAAIALTGAFAVTSLSPALAAAAAAKHNNNKKQTGACAAPNGRCVSDCDAFNWCVVYTCNNGQSTPVPFWRCFEPSGLCLAPRC